MEDLNKSHKPLTGIGEDCVINNAILDKNCFIGNNVTINGGSHLEATDTDKYTIKEGIIVIKKNAVIEDGTVIG